MVVLTVGFVLGDQGYPYITFESEDDINIGDHFSVRGDNYTFYFKASKLEVLGDKLLVTAREVGKRNGVDLRGAIGGEVKIINDDDLLSFEGHQYLTLDQWVELFLPKKQEVDFSILNDEDWFYVELDVLDRKAIHVLRGVELKTHKYETDGYEVECLFYKMGYGYHEPYKATLNMNSSIHNIRDCIRVLRKATPEDLKPLYNKYPELAPLKVGDWAIGYDDPHHQRNLKKVQKELEKYGILNIGIFHHMNCDEYYIGDELWDNAYKIHPNQPLDKQIDNFLKLQLK